MLLAVVGATLLSTLAMVLYPVLVQAVGFTSYRAGMFLGSTIHDVVQDSAPLDTATAVKLFRVMLLMPVVLGVALVLHGQAACGAPAGHAADVGWPRRRPRRQRTALLPGFMLAFGVSMVLGSLVELPAALRSGAGTVSRALLLVAIAAVDVRTSLHELTAQGWRPTLFSAGRVRQQGQGLRPHLWVPRCHPPLWPSGVATVVDFSEHADAQAAAAKGRRPAQGCAGWD